MTRYGLIIAAIRIRLRRLAEKICLSERKGDDMFKINLVGLDDFDRDLKKEIEAEKKKIALKLSRIGEEYVNDVKEKGNYQDHTKNLRNSHSYRVYIDGRVFHESIGRPETNIMFEKMRVDVGIQLIVGSGMEYASWVEGKGFNVVSSGFSLVERKLSELFNK